MWNVRGTFSHSQRLYVNSVKSTFLLELISRDNWSKILQSPELIHNHSAVWKLRKFSSTIFWQKFRESSVYYYRITKFIKSWLHEIFFVRYFSFFQSTRNSLSRKFLQCCGKTRNSLTIPRLFREINFLRKTSL